MPNRILKESICRSETINQLTADQEVFFYRLLVNCDDFGRYSADLDMLASYLYPKQRALKTATVKKRLDALVKVGLVATYLNNDKKYLQITSWDEHQQIRSKKSKYPDPNDERIAIDITCNQLISDDCKCPRNPIQSESNPNTSASAKFAPPTLEEVKAYCDERKKKAYAKGEQYNVDPDKFFEFFTEGGWIDSRGHPVLAWKQKLITWENHSQPETQGVQDDRFADIDM